MRPLIVSIPHSGERVPAEAEWLKNLPEVLLMYDVDRFVNQLYQPVIETLQLKAVIADIHRYAIDLNRLATDVDAGTVVGSAFEKGKFSRGLHWAITTTGEKLMSGPITQALHNELVAKYFEPFHMKLKERYSEMHRQGFSRIFHLDLHSMPSVGTSEHLDPGERRADIVVSDRDGMSASKKFKDLVVESYRQSGFKVAYNWPYKGGRLTEAYGDPDQGHEVIQVELNRSLYMNEKTKKLNIETLEEMQMKLEQAVIRIYEMIPSERLQ